MATYSLFEILIIYTALLVTVASGVIAFILYHFVPLKVDVAKMQTKVSAISEMVDETRHRQTRLIAILRDDDLDSSDIEDE